MFSQAKINKIVEIQLTTIVLQRKKKTENFFSS